MVEVLLHTCRNDRARYFCLMFSLTRREQLLVAFVLLAFCAGLGVKHWRDVHALTPLQAEAEIGR
jgi:hypothetical protein